jgi:hypothetical protein
MTTLTNNSILAATRVRAYAHTRHSQIVRAVHATTTKTATKATKGTQLATIAALSTQAATFAFPALSLAAADVLTTSEATWSQSNPALLGFTCVAVCWGIPQTLGTAILAEKEQRGRDVLAANRVDASDINPGNWGKVQRRLQDNGLMEEFKSRKQK